LLAEALGKMSDGLIILDGSRRVRFCNPRAGEFLGVAAEMLVGKSDQEAFALIQQSLESPRMVWTKWERALGAASERSSFFVEAGPDRSQDAIVEIFALGDQDSTPGGVGILLRDGTAAKQLTLMEERERIAMNLHDGVIQSLYAIALGLGARDRSLSGEKGQAREAIHQAIGQINAVIDEVRDYIVGLRQHDLAAAGLCAGIDRLAEELRASTLVIPAVEIAEQADRALTRDAITNVLYIAREATSNVIRHSGARAVSLRLAVVDQRVVLAIHDDGQGFETTHTGRRVGDGLRNMDERARAIGGDLIVTSEPGRGTEVRLEVPIDARAASRHTGRGRG
jgi:signal transduction histidine kinase